MMTNFREDADILPVHSNKNYTSLEGVTCTVERDKYVNALTRFLCMILNS